MSLTVIALSVVCFLVLVISPVVGWTTAGNPLLTTITLLPLFGLPVGFVLLMALIVMSAIRRGRAARSAR
ncbi:MAG: hypothetical protein JWP66_1937 [Naasia sp.]|nr:hypothetical protein [Naasia sp.]